MSKINILLSSDSSYALFLLVTIISILENSDNKESLTFHIISDRIDDNFLNKIKLNIKKYNSSYTIYSTDSSELKDLPAIGHLSKAAYLRLLAPEILSQDIDKILYLDCDLVTLKDISDLYNIDINDYYLAASADLRSKGLAKNFDFLGLTEFFNSGVMLINLKKWRENKLTEKALAFAKKYKDKLITADQDILNCLLKNKWKKIKRIYNFDSKDLIINKIPKNTVILHYSGEIKPWSYLYFLNDKKYFFKYLNLIPNHNFNYSDKSFKNLIIRNIKHFVFMLKNILRPLIPSFILEKKRLSYNNKIKRRF